MMQGVSVCLTRYKILLGSDVLDPFLNIGDGSGSGADHCELVGGYQLGAVIANDYVNSPSVNGTDFLCYYIIHISHGFESPGAFSIG